MREGKLGNAIENRGPMSFRSLLDITPVGITDWAEKIGDAERGGSAIVIFYSSSFAVTDSFRYFLTRLSEQILPYAQPHQFFRFCLDESPKFATALVRKLGVWNVRIDNGGLLWSGNGTQYVLGDRAFASNEVLDQHLRALCVNRQVRLPDNSPLDAPVAASASTNEIPAIVQSKPGRPGTFVIIGVLAIAAVGGISLFSGDPAYVSQCRSLWWERSGRDYPAVDVSYRRVGNGEMSRRSDNRLVGYYTDFVVTLKFDNFGKQGRIHLQCVANSQKAFAYMKTDDSDWIGGRPGPIGVSFVRADGTYSVSPPDLN